MKRYLLILITIFLTINVNAEGIEADNLNKQIKLLQSRQVDTILIHKYALFNGSFHIRTDNKELFCQGIPYVYHVFWKKNGKMFCKRLDDCGEFMDVPVQVKNIETVVSVLSSTQIEFKK